jgi:hypothetical protein
MAVCCELRCSCSLDNDVGQMTQQTTTNNNNNNNSNVVINTDALLMRILSVAMKDFGREKSATFLRLIRHAILSGNSGRQDDIDQQQALLLVLPLHEAIVDFTTIMRHQGGSSSSSSLLFVAGDGGDGGTDNAAAAGKTNAPCLARNDDIVLR